jgi:hypothetical protein
MDKEIVTALSLMDDASSFYINLFASGDWKNEVIKHAQIIALTTQISELKQEFSQVKSLAKSSNKEPTPFSNQKLQFKNWHLTKVDNNTEFNMVEKDGKKYY